MGTRDRLKKVAAKSPEMWSAYTKQWNKVTKEFRYSIHDYYKGLIKKNKQKITSLWESLETFRMVC